MKIEAGSFPPDLVGIRNDCAVRAVSNGFAVPYDKAALICKAHGRKRKNAGMKYPAVVTMLQALGATKLDGNWPLPVHVHVSSLDTAKTYAVIVRKPGHIFIVRSGVLLDSGGDYNTWRSNFRRARILAVWEVPQANQQPTQINLFAN